MFAPSSAFPVGGTTAIFEFADGLARRGHDVTLAHTTFAFGLTPVEDIWWHRFEPSVVHLFDEDPPPGDVAISYFGDIRPDLGRPFMWVQARYIVPGEEEILLARCPKLCTSTWLQDVVRQEGIGPAHHVPYGLRHAKWRSTRPWAEREPVVAMLYNAHPTKGGAIGVAALREVKAKRPDARCVAFGTLPLQGPPAPELEFLLNPPQEDLVELLGSARAFVQPSIYEGFGMASIEAMASGATLVTTDCGGSRDYANEHTAYVVPPGEPSALADAVIQALDSGADRAAAGERHAAQYDWDRSAEILEAVLLS